MATTEIIFSIAGLSLIISILAIMLCFLLVNIFQEIHEKITSKRAVKFIQEKDKEVD